MWPWSLTSDLEINRVLDIVEVYVRAKFHQAKCSGSSLSCWQRKKRSDDAENNTAIASAGSDELHAHNNSTWHVTMLYSLLWTCCTTNRTNGVWTYTERVLNAVSRATAIIVKSNALMTSNSAMPTTSSPSLLDRTPSVALLPASSCSVSSCTTHNN